jgi:hypothetical protein
MNLQRGKQLPATVWYIHSPYTNLCGPPFAVGPPLPHVRIESSVQPALAA